MNITRLLAFFTSFFLLCPIYASVDSYFSHIKKDSSALYAFFKTMPKGGELHYHLAGGAYPETMLALAANGNYCLDKHSFAVSKDSSHCEGVNVKEVFNNPELYSNIIKDWSMKDFIPGKESGHDHFFNGFVKYMPIVFDYRPQLLADIVQRAAQQKEQYMEIMIIPDNAHSLTYGDLIKDTPSYDQKRRLLLANKDFQSNIKNTVLESDRILTKASQELGCKDNPSSDFC
ncbi:TPA: adenosine deaminase, partial [Legionella pneumophila]|nr:adenosine deaminase [Legionella pneumophila]